jgi:hypothetical protein
MFRNFIDQVNAIKADLAAGDYEGAARKLVKLQSSAIDLLYGPQTMQAASPELQAEFKVAVEECVAQCHVVGVNATAGAVDGARLNKILNLIQVVLPVILRLL